MEEAIRLRQESTGYRGGRDSTLSRYYLELARGRGQLGRTVEAVKAASTALLSANPRNRRETEAARQSLYDALKKGMGDATDRFGELEDRFRRIVHVEDDGRRRSRDESAEAETGRDERERKKLSDWIAYSSPDFDKLVENAVERVFRLLDLPRRSDVEALNHNLERVASAVETLEGAFARGHAVGLKVGV